MCRLAIPFIVLTYECDTEMLIWPLRSIVMEWKTKAGVFTEEALVKVKTNMVSIVRYGQSYTSKSKMMNDLLSSGHDVFFHKNAPRGQARRLVSNGTVEMSHFLPAGNERDRFPEPALFFNLRGDACDYPDQHSLIMDLGTILVIVTDIEDLHSAQVQQMLKDSTKKMKTHVIVILTDSKKHEVSDINQSQEKFSDLVGDDLGQIEVITTFDMQVSGKDNIYANEEIRDAIKTKMSTGPQRSIEDFVKVLKTSDQRLVDEYSKSCSGGKKYAENILSEIKVDISTVKGKLLPAQGTHMDEMGKLLRKLHQTSPKETLQHETEKIKSDIESIRREQFQASNDSSVIVQHFIVMLGLDDDTKNFAIQWLKLELDALSRSVLPELRKRKNSTWRSLMEARTANESEKVKSLEEKIHQIEKDIDGATCGFEHLMRELGQIHEVAVSLKNLDSQSSVLHQTPSSLPDLVARLLLDGHPVELMDGDHRFLPLIWVKEVFQSLANMASETCICVVSVLGIQSSGKSTLLNTMFGINFAVSAGRCTKGIYAQLLPVAEGSSLQFGYILVLDSEG